MYTRVHEIFFGLPRIQKEYKKSLSRQKRLRDEFLVVPPKFIHSLVYLKYYIPLNK